MIIYFLSRSTCLHVCWLLAGNLLEGLITSWLPSDAGLPVAGPDADAIWNTQSDWVMISLLKRYIRTMR